MATVEWTVEAELNGEFHMMSAQHSSNAPLVEGLQRLVLHPKLDVEGKLTGHIKLEAILSFEKGTDDAVESHIVYERAKRLVENVAALAALGIGRPVRFNRGFTVKCQLSDNPPKFRCITGVVESRSVSGPRQVPVELLTISIDRKIQRIIRWWSRGLATSDAVDRLVALNNSLDLLSGMIDGVPDRVRRCKKCGAEESIGPGLRERVTYLLTNMAKYSESVAKEIYESRNALAHAGSDLDEEDLRRYRRQANLVAAAVRDGVAKILKIKLPPIPKPMPIDLPSSLVVLDYVEKSSTYRPNRNQD